MQGPRTAVAVVVSAGGTQLSDGAVADPPRCRLLAADIAVGQRAACAVLTVAHDCSLPALEVALFRWASARGWTVTVAPVSGSG